MNIVPFSRTLVAVAALLVAPVSSAGLVAYSQNFEGLSGPGALSGVGFQVSGLLFDGNTGVNPPYGTFKFFYGNFPAPNGTGFSAIAGGDGGPAQGTQYLNAYSDYNCCGPGTTNEGHFDSSAPFDYVQSNVFQEQTIGPADIGSTWTLTFDAKLPSTNGCETTATSDCIAFIRTLNPNAGFAQTNLVSFDAQTLSNAAWSTHTILIDLSDPLLNGQVLQFGFQSTSQKFGNTGVYYDNIVFANPMPVDADLDGIPDATDNCTLVANPTQCDSDGDGFGNRCDGDLNNNGATNAQDTSMFRPRLGLTVPGPVYDKADLNCNGVVNAQDTSMFRQLLGAPPGPSAEVFALRPLPPIYTTGKAIAYSAFRAGGPGAGEVPSDANILEDLGLLDDAGFNLLRLFGADTVSEKILTLAAANYPQMKFQQGIFLAVPAPSCVNAINTAQIAKGISLANQFASVVTVSVGNETSLTGNLDITCLESYVQTVRSQVTQPVTADDDYTFYNGTFFAYKPNGVLAGIDFVSIHMYPFLNYSFWNWQQTGTPAGPARAAAMMNAALAKDQSNFATVYNYLYTDASGATVSIGASLPIVIGETGWKAVQTNPGSPIETYAANPVNAKWYYDLMGTWEGSVGGPLTIFYFEATDEAWKGTDDGWGLWDKNRLPRYGLCGTPAGAACNPDLYQGAGFYPF